MLTTVGNLLIESRYNEQRHFKIKTKKSRIYLLEKPVVQEIKNPMQEFNNMAERYGYHQYASLGNLEFASLNSVILKRKSGENWQEYLHLQQPIKFFTDENSIFLIRYNELWDLLSKKILQCFPGFIVALACDYLHDDRFTCWYFKKYYIWSKSGNLELILQYRPIAMHVFYVKNHRFLIIRCPDYMDKKFQVHEIKTHPHH